MAYMDGFRTATHTISGGRYRTAEEAWATERAYGDVYGGFGDEVEGQLRDMFFRGYADGAASRQYPSEHDRVARYDEQVLAYDMQRPNAYYTSSIPEVYINTPAPDEPPPLLEY
jgi:hypothetical protein